MYFQGGNQGRWELFPNPKSLSASHLLDPAGAQRDSCGRKWALGTIGAHIAY